MNVSAEVWKSAPEPFNIRYEVSNLGRIRNKYSKKFLTGGTNNKGYNTVCLSWKGEVKCFLIHILVALTFKGPIPPGKEIDHKDTDKENNSESNLQYLTDRQNKLKSWNNAIS